MRSRYTKTSAERSVFLDRKLAEYGARLRANPEYDRWRWRRYRLLSYRNYVYKLFNREMRDSIRRELRK
ncbi:hypothetical protein [Paenibacillus graminis]|uniref:hypothetical protein n=1 Tax=Paenibacillus graminis TaxID=189425 RepID=UPI002DBD7A1A|nr:hypothetical protein [Paenibacillus graminis]MEC0167876.1 hypothetical protein [Paenibacillus graminis]